MVQPITTPTPTLNKWVFHDQLMRGHITLNCTDVAGLGSIDTIATRNVIQEEVLTVSDELDIII